MRHNRTITTPTERRERHLSTCIAHTNYLSISAMSEVRRSSRRVKKLFYSVGDIVEILNKKVWHFMHDSVFRLAQAPVANVRMLFPFSLSSYRQRAISLSQKVISSPGSRPRRPRSSVGLSALTTPRVPTKISTRPTLGRFWVKLQRRKTPLSKQLAAPLCLLYERPAKLARSRIHPPLP
jgi:hypothetical protein